MSRRSEQVRVPHYGEGGGEGHTERTDRLVSQQLFKEVRAGKGTTLWEGGGEGGKLNGRTGWFPSNYVKEVRAGKGTTLWGEGEGGTLNGQTGWFPSNICQGGQSR